MEQAPAKRPRTRRRTLIWFLLANTVLTTCIAVVAVYFAWTAFARALPDLDPWHLEHPASEFTAVDAEPGYTLADYLEQEAAVFDELDRMVDAEWARESGTKFSRFVEGSISDPRTVVERNWNRSLVLEADEPRGGALLIHGLSDSPYSLRSVGEWLHARGWTVVWLRVPGHGTTPGALAEVSSIDWEAAVRVAALGLRDALPEGAPLTVYGYSNGGSLAVGYAASALEDPDLPRPDAVVLFSPMLGINPLARITEAYTLVGRISSLEKVAWSRVEAEVDPFKYSSWPMNASVQAWRSTARVEARLARLARRGRLDDFPPVLTFQSVVDSTVSVVTLVQRLYDRVAGPESELYLFDVNRRAIASGLLFEDVTAEVETVLRRPDRDFVVSLLTNVEDGSPRVLERRWVGETPTDTPKDAAWPRGVFSLSHGAPPIPPDDPILGTSEATVATGLPLGSLALRGETGVLRLSEALMMRLRHNPFHDLMLERLAGWLDETLRDDGAPSPPNP